MENLTENYKSAQALADRLVDRGYGCEAGTNEWVEEIEKLLDQKDREWISRLGVAKKALEAVMKSPEVLYADSDTPRWMALCRQALQTLKEMGV